MNLRLLAAFLSLATLASGCVIHHDGSGGSGPQPAVRGDVAFTWSLAGQDCAQAHQVARVRIHIPGETLANGGLYPCTTNGVMGIVLHDFQPATYTFTIDALAANGERLYGESGSFRVNGNTPVHVDMRPVQAMVDLTWRFPGNSQASTNPTCQQAGVAYVEAYIDDVPQQAYINGQRVMMNIRGQWRDVIPCEWGQSGTGFRVTVPGSGTRSLKLYGLGADGYTYYSFSGPLQAQAGTVAAAEYTLGWAVGGAAVSWQLWNGTRYLSCQEAGVTTMRVHFVDDSGYAPYGQAGDAQPCTAAPVVYDYLPPGRYWVYVYGYTSTEATQWLYTSGTPPQVTVEAGRFVGPESAVGLTLTR
jgi:hypothetical protein